jgi:chemotaxis protein methyltransferase CheR
MTRPSTNDSASGRNLLGLPVLDSAEFNLLRDLILEDCGIQVAPTKRLLIQNRVGRRVKHLGFTSYYSYYRYLQTDEGRSVERENLWSAITTNETHFFRESHHFDVLRRVLLKEVVSRPGPRRRVRIWSAGCSTGQEPYTLAMALDDFLGNVPGWGFEVVGTDIDHNVLKAAQRGVYPAALKKEIPARFLMRYTETAGGELHIRPELKKHVSFRQTNLSTVEAARPRFDFIFCRNVIMYLHMQTRARLAGVFKDSLLRGGALILGSSESFHGLPKVFDVERHGKTAVYRVPSGVTHV